MKAIDCPFTKIINGTTQFVIPVFQRDYSWTEAQCEQLWDDILLVGRDSSSRGHFMGSVVYVATGNTSAGFTSWLLIDGQQRVTTLTLLLTALRDHIQAVAWKGDDDGPTTKRIDAYFLKNMEEEGRRKHKLVLRRHDQETLMALIDQKEPPKFSSERIKENYEFFRDRLEEADPAEVYRGVNRLVVVDVTLDHLADDPQLIFESLNSTGVDLSQSDLIRNFILMRLEEREQTRLYEAYWSKIDGLFRGSESKFDAFVRDYMALKIQVSKQEKASDIYQAFRRSSRQLTTELGGDQELLKDMLRYARFNAAFSIGTDDFPALREELSNIRRQVDVAATLVMRLFDCHDNGKLPTTAFKEALQLIESYLFRRAICGDQTRGYWQVFANLAYRIREEDPLGSLKVSLARLRDSYRFPGNEDFRRELEQRDIYGMRDCGYMLEKLENHGSKEPSNTARYTIEHILPQNEKLPAQWKSMLGAEWKQTQSTWLHRLGNLTLTGYNSTYSDRPFEEKKTIPGGFEESSVRLNKFVKEQAKWTAEEIESRGRLLAKRALTIWPMVAADKAEIEAAEHAELKDLASKRDVSKVPMSPEARELFDQLRPKIRAMAPESVEVAEQKSVSYHSQESGFFLEVLPRKRRLTLLLPLDLSEITDPAGLATDATEWKFLFYAKYEGGVLLRIATNDDIDHALPIIKQALLTNG